MPSFYHPEIETLDRSSLDALIDERVRYTIRYAYEHSAFYRHWFKENGINPDEIRYMRTSCHFPSFPEELFANTSRRALLISSSFPPTGRMFLPSRKRVGRAGHLKVSFSRGMTGSATPKNMPGVLYHRGLALRIALLSVHRTA